MKTLAIALLLLCIGTACTTTKQYEIRSVNGTAGHEGNTLNSIDMFLIRVDLVTGNECAVGTVPFYPTQQGHYIYRTEMPFAAVEIPACTK